MSRYIDADKLKYSLELSVKSWGRDCNSNAPVIKTTYQDVLNRLGAMPAADVVEVVHAYWKETTHITESKRGREIHSKLYNCSNCDAPNGRKKSRYCHWCGAKMDGERREE